MSTAERRFSERPGSRKPVVVEESWFGAFGADTELHEEAAADDESHFSNGLHQAASAPKDSRFLSRQAARAVKSGTSAFERIYRTFIAARAALGVADRKSVV